MSAATMTKKAPAVTNENDQPVKIETRAVTEGAKAQYDVSWGDFSERIKATGEREAWALFCDKNQTWPSPKSGKVVKVA